MNQFDGWLSSFQSHSESRFRFSEKLGDKRRRKQQDQVDTNLNAHLETLGIKSVSAYQQWCAENGFSRRLKKSQADRRKERIAAVNRRSDQEHRSLKRASLPHHKAVDRILSGKLTFDDVGEKRHRTLCSAVERLSQLNDQHRQDSLNAFLTLFELCENRRAKFVGGSLPSNSASRSCSYVEALASVAAFSHRYIRPPETWRFRTHNPRRQFDSLITHLFSAYLTPRFFYTSWFLPDFEIGLKHQSAFVHVAAGHSIRTANIPITYTKPMSRQFLTAPTECSFPEALRWGQVFGLGGDSTLARAVLSTELGTSFANDEFWQTVIKWFVEHPMLDRNLFGVVYDYLHHQKFGHANVARFEIGPDGRQRHFFEGPAQPNLAMKGRTPRALIGNVETWHRRLHLVGRKSVLRWSHSGIKEFLLAEGAKEDDVWTIRQLLGSQALIEEGQAMNHCVASYANSCNRNQTSIWTMRRQLKGLQKRVLTVEVRLCDLAICQVRGKNNRLADANEIKILRRWAQVADLKLASSTQR